MKEKDFESWVIDVARYGGWQAWHVPMPMRPIGGGRFVPEPRGAGLPDWIFMHEDPPRLIFAELKGTGGSLRAEQRVFLRLAKAVADEIRDLYESVEEAGEETGEWPALCQEVPIGVYTWRPGDESMIEAILMGKVMVR